MSISTPNRGFQAVQPAAVPNDLVWRLSVDQYHEMLRAGILTDGDPVELLDGWLVAKMMQNPFHSTVVELIRKALDRRCPDGWHVRSEKPVTLADSEPEPDVMVVRGALLDYLDRHPVPNDVALIVEVADTSLDRDQTTKKRLYAAAGIPIYWIVNLLDRRVEVYTVPSGPAEQPDYRERRDLGLSEQVEFVLDGRAVVSLPVRDFLP
jgi:Uma2 family endonuclease